MANKIVEAVFVFYDEFDVLGFCVVYEAIFSEFVFLEGVDVGIVPKKCGF